MINDATIFSDADSNISTWVAQDATGTDLAYSAEVALSRHGDFVSVMPNAVSDIWPWLEKSDIKILARFYLENIGAAVVDETIADLSARINSAFKAGANGAQIFMSWRNFPTFCRHIYAIRDDLFFNKHLSIGLDISEIDAMDWGEVFNNLSNVRADSVVLAFVRDAGDKSDLVGRVYGMLSESRDWTGGLHFIPGDNSERVEQVYRLASAMRPDDVKNLSFFIKP